jgi:hypothetical protein
MRLRLLVAAAAVTALPLMLGGVAASASSTVHAAPARTAPVARAVQAAPAASAIPVHLAVHGVPVSSSAATPPVTTAGLRNAPVPGDCFDTWVVSVSGTRSYLAVGTHGDDADLETYATCFNADEVIADGSGGFNWYLIAGNGGCLQLDTKNYTITNESCDSEENVELWAHPSAGNGASNWLNLEAFDQNTGVAYLADPLSNCATPAHALVEDPGNDPGCVDTWYNN